MTHPGSPAALPAPPRARTWARAPRGATAVLVAIGLVMLCAFLALAINVGHLFSVRGELQNAADSGALAGARDLNGTTGPLQTAIDSGALYAQRHATDTGTSVQVVTGDVEIGFWDRSTKTFTPYAVSAVTPALAACSSLPCVNAVRARTYRDPNHAGDVPIALGGILGTSSSALGTTAVAVTGGPCSVNCIGLPIVLPDCGINPFIKPECVGGEYKVLFINDTTDTAAWADVGSGASTVKCVLQASLTNPSASGTCSNDTSCKITTNLAAATDVNVINGQINSACSLITQLYAQHPENKYMVPVVSAPCSAKWVQNFPIVTFVTVQISWAPPDCTGTNKYFMVRILCEQVTTVSSDGGCVAAGTWTIPHLAQ